MHAVLFSTQRNEQSSMQGISLVVQFWRKVGASVRIVIEGSLEDFVVFQTHAYANHIKRNTIHVLCMLFCSPEESR